MAKKISQLTQATEVKSDDVTVIVQDGETKKLPLNMMVTKQDIENKKVAGLAKLDEIEATYENDTYTPTITVKNKSSVKVGEGDEVDYSANVMDGHVKSAILKGQTMVNLATPIEYKTIMYHGYCLVFNGSMLKSGEYTLKSSVDFSQYIINILSTQKDKPSRYKRITIRKNGVFTIDDTFFVANDIKTEDFFICLRPIDNADSGTTTTNEIENCEVILLEGDYTNVDIPYFEGMQSVKMPVLTTTTSQNLSSVPFSFFEKTTDRKYGAWTIFEFDNLFSGKIILNKRPFNNIMYFDTKENRLNIGTTVVKDVQFIGFYNPSTNIENNNKGNLLELLESGELDISLQENGKTNIYSYKKNDKTNILTVNEPVELRGIGDVKDELDCLTGKVTERIGEIVLNGSENYSKYTSACETVYGFSTKLITNSSEVDTALCDKLPVQRGKSVAILDEEGIFFREDLSVMYLKISKSKLSDGNPSTLKAWLAENNVTFAHQLKENVIKTVDLMPSGTHPSTTPYCWKNGHIQLSSSGLLPSLEYSVVTSRAGQINQNATMIVKNDKRIFDLEILLAGGLVNTTYQALTLQNQVETGLSKVSLNSETEPDYLLYHMIMKLIEEKAYKLDDLTEKVSVFYLYEKLSDEQFETIYSVLYPFVEDEIVEEPVVEELPEVVEDEVIM